MELVIHLLIALFAIFVVIVVHECGHFCAARAVGIKVLRFSIGFGKTLLSFKGRSGTVYALSLLPFGGYVKMLGEGDEVVTSSAKQQAFNHKPVWARMFVTLAGPVANFVLAFVLFWFVYLGGVTHIKPVVGSVVPASIAAKASIVSGEEITAMSATRTRNWQQVMMQLIAEAGNKRVSIQLKSVGTGAVKQRWLNLSQWRIQQKSSDLLMSVGLLPFQPPIAAVIAEVLKDSPASLAGIKKGDRIVAVQGKKTKNWGEAAAMIARYPDKTIDIAVLRSGGLRHFKVKTAAKEHQQRRVGFLGVMVKQPDWPQHLKYHESFSIFTAFAPAWRQTISLIKLNAIVLGKMVIGNISVSALGGPISIFQTAGKASDAGVRIFIGFIAFISIALGFINLLPIPILDGGHFMFQVIELIFRKPVPMRVQFGLLKVGLLVLLFVMILATVNDISRLV